MTVTAARLVGGIGGVDVRDLAAQYGTPLLVIDTDVLDANIAVFEALAATYDVDVAYAGKALLFVALARRLAASSLALDVCSLGELLTAERAGMPPERLVLHGCAKSREELEAACDGRVGRIVVDHPGELAALATLARERTTKPLRLLLRINPSIEARTHAYVRTGGEASKFGFDATELDAAIDLAVASPELELVGIHSHLGSQIFDPATYEASLPQGFAALARAHARGAPVRELSIGGGFGVDSHENGDHIDLAALLDGLQRAGRELAVTHAIPLPRLGIEPGRRIIASAGTSLYRVLAVKERRQRRVVIVDGGLADNPRPALYGAHHTPHLAGRTSTAAPRATTVYGRSCENDRLVEAELPGDLAPGDLLALATTGAYTYAMASNYNRVPRPAVAFAGGGHHRLVVRRERDLDILRHDVQEG